MLQFLLESGHHIVQQSLEAGQSPQRSTPIRIPKTPEVLERMRQAYDLAYNPKARLSATALNSYLDCQLRFYLRYVAGLQAPEEVSAEIDSATFGSIFHKSAEYIYQDLTGHGNLITKEQIESLLKDQIRLESYVDRAFKELFFRLPENERPEYNGTQLINSAVIVRYIKQLLRHDMKVAPFHYVASEKSVSEEVTIHHPSGDFKTRVGGIIDRMDTQGDTLRILDYKTGGKPDMPPSVESLFIPSKNRSNYVFQTFLYASIMNRKQDLKVAPALLYIHKAASENYSPVICLKEGKKEAIPVTDFSRYEPEFREGLQNLLDEIFHPDTDFTQTEIEDKCTYCDFKAFCKK
jgi:CRISPR/Cas system-associated exonuclease Cas4 (RecB family)